MTQRRQVQEKKPEDGKARKRKRASTFPSSSQAEMLEAAWKKGRKLKNSDYEELAKKLEAGVQDVKKWFRDQRKKLKADASQPGCAENQSEVPSGDEGVRPQAPVRKSGIFQQSALASSVHEVELSDGEDDRDHSPGSTRAPMDTSPSTLEKPDRQATSAGPQQTSSALPVPSEPSKAPPVSADQQCATSTDAAAADNPTLGRGASPPPSPGNTEQKESPLPDDTNTTKEPSQGQPEAQPGPQPQTLPDATEGALDDSPLQEGSTNATQGACAEAHRIEAHAAPSGEDHAQAAEGTQEATGDRAQTATAAEGQALKRAADSTHQDQPPANKRARVGPLEECEVGDAAPGGGVPAAPVGGLPAAPAPSAPQPENKRAKRQKNAASGTTASEENRAGHLHAAREEAAALGEALAAWPWLEKLPERLAPKRGEMKRTEVKPPFCSKVRSAVEQHLQKFSCYGRGCAQTVPTIPACCWGVPLTASPSHLPIVQESTIAELIGTTVVQECACKHV